MKSPKCRVVFQVPSSQKSHGVKLYDPALHEETLSDLAAFVESETGLLLSDATYSPIRGPEGNIEFLFLLGLKSNTIVKHADIDFGKLVEEAHVATK